MRRYRDRYLRKISTGITIAYLSTAILAGVVGCTFINEREELKQKYIDGEISHEYYISKGMEFTEREENLFRCLGIGFGLTYVADLVFNIACKGKEY